MTPVTKVILTEYEVRKTSGQRRAFRQWLTPILQENGWAVREEKGSFGVRNLVIGDPDTAKVIYTTHYDTCVRLPFPNFITPKSPGLYVLYQILLTAAIFLACGIASYLGGMAFGAIGNRLAFYGVIALLLFGPANPHNANDNTSGVTAVVELALTMPEELRHKCAFVLFDLEESGLLGSESFAKKHKNVKANTLLVNMDCVSDGETMIFCFRKDSRAEVERFRALFAQDHRIRPEFLTKGYVYPSDQIYFDRGVGVSAMRSTKKGLLYMNRIHTKRDTVYREENIAWLVDGCTRLAEFI